MATLRGFWSSLYDLSKDPLLIADGRRMEGHFLHRMSLLTNEYEFRYERRGDEFVLRRWYNGNEKSHRDYVYATPDWLKPILDVARVSGHLKRTVEPPPDEILWFRTDHDFNLTTFIDLEGTKT